MNRRAAPVGWALATALAFFANFFVVYASGFLGEHAARFFHVAEWTDTQGHSGGSRLGTGVCIVLAGALGGAVAGALGAALESVVVYDKAALRVRLIGISAVGGAIGIGWLFLLAAFEVPHAVFLLGLLVPGAAMALFQRRLVRRRAAVWVLLRSLAFVAGVVAVFHWDRFGLPSAAAIGALVFGAVCALALRVARPALATYSRSTSSWSESRSS